MPKPSPKPGLLFHLGGFFGEIAKAIRTDVSQKQTTLKHEVREQPVQTDAGPGLARHTIKEELQINKPDGDHPPTVTARRTTIEEVVVTPKSTND